MQLQPMPHRVTFGVDIEGYSKRSDPEQVELQARLCWITKHALKAAGVNPKRCGRQDQGDAQLISLPTGVDLAGVLPALPRAVQAAIHQVNSVPVSAGPMRLRMSMAQGPVQTAATGFVGTGVISAAWILDSQMLRDVLGSSPQADLVMAVTDDLYRQVFRHGHGGLAADDFRSALIENPAKKFAVHVWIFVPSSPPGQALVPAFTRPAGEDRTALWGAAIPLAGIGAGIWIEHHQDHQVPDHPTGHNASGGDHHVGSAATPSASQVADSGSHDAGSSQVYEDQHEIAHHGDSHGGHHDADFFDHGLADALGDADFIDPGGIDAQYPDFGADSGDPGGW